MDIEEIKVRKLNMEQVIEEEILAFERDTGLIIDQLSLLQDFIQARGHKIKRAGRPFIETKVML